MTFLVNRDCPANYQGSRTEAQVNAAEKNSRAGGLKICRVWHTVVAIIYSALNGCEASIQGSRESGKWFELSSKLIKAIFEGSDSYKAKTSYGFNSSK